MKHSPFRFKQFSIRHDRTTMKVGTDGVLLGAWTNIKDAKNILDIGSGSGLIALMLAQRSDSDAIIDAVEIEQHAYSQSVENINHSSWRNKVIAHHTSIQNFHPEKKYDLIVSNPPYFQNSQKPTDEKRQLTRHTDTLPFQQLLQAVSSLIKLDGYFNIILPYQEAQEFISLAINANLFISRQWIFRTRSDKPIERLLLEFTTQNILPETGEILLYEKDEDWSLEYKTLTKEFYLKL